MFSKKKGLPIETLIGKQARLVGNMTFVGGLRLDGQLLGNLTAEDKQRSMLVLSEHASIEGEVRAAHIIVSGTITGPVYASELLELQPKARILGNVHYAALEMHQGAVVEGVLAHISDADKTDKPTLKLAASNES